VSGLQPTIGDTETANFEIIAKDKNGNTLPVEKMGKMKYDIKVKGKRHHVEPKVEVSREFFCY
jgi:hypothetical protein